MNKGGWHGFISEARRIKTREQLGEWDDFLGTLVAKIAARVQGGASGQA